VPELHANFAFTRAYLADQVGTKGGFAGNRLFIDLALFKRGRSHALTWIKFADTVQLAQEGLEANFGTFQSIDRRKAGESAFRGILDAFEIAENLSRIPGGAERLRTSYFAGRARSVDNAG
jgi:hypothetical protein